MDKPELELESESSPEVKSLVNPDPDVWKFDPNYSRLISHFKIDSGESHLYQDKLQTILGWAQDTTKSSDIIDNLTEIKALQRSLGFTSLEKSINEVYRWIVLDRQEQQTKKEKELLKRA